MKYYKKTVLNFGKYKGQTIADVLSLNPSYLVWASNTISWFELDRKILNKARQNSINHSFRRHVSRYIEDCPYWIDEDNGSWLS